jgi:hypothetical protein
MEHRAAAAAGRAIRLALSEGRFQAEDVRRGLDDPPSESTVTRVLQQLEADDWLQRTSSNSSLWRAGPHARIYGDMDDRALEAAREPAAEPGGRPPGDSDDVDFFP